MKCSKCGGLMVGENFYDFLDTYIEFKGFRCLLCGEILDDRILKHRQKLDAVFQTQTIIA